MGRATGTSEVNISELVPYERNAKQHSPEQVQKIADSIREFGFLSPILIDGAGNIIAGHGRVEAAKLLGMKSVPAVYIEGLTDEQRRAYILADNRLTELGGWDLQLVDAELQDLAAMGFDIDLTGFELDIPVEEPASIAVKEDNFDEDLGNDQLELHGVKPGQIWQLGRHRLMCGSSASEDDYRRLMDGHEARLCVTSPPYGVGMEYETAGIEPWRKTVFGVIDVVTKHTRIICWNIGDLYATGTQFIEPTSMYSTERMAENGFGLMYSRIWKKQGANFNGVNPYHLVSMKPVQEYEWILGYGKRDYEKDFAPIQEYMLRQAETADLNNEKLAEITGARFMYGHWFTPHQWTMMDKDNYTKIQSWCAKNGINAFTEDYDVIRRQYDNLNLFQKTLTDSERNAFGQWAIWEISTVSDRNIGHPAAFPVELPARCIKMHTREDDIVTEPFCGSGTTIIASEQLNRSCYAMEISPKYCEIAIRRWETFTGKKAVLSDE